ncbi:MAG: TlpA family protein disulfide reductase [Rhizomicrobium sp.]
MRKFLVWTAGTVGAVLVAILALAGAMWLSEDVRYGVVYVVSEHADLNPPIPQAQLIRQVAALRRAHLVGEDGRPLSLNTAPHTVVWVNAWANWCVPCRMEFPAMKALQDRVGRDKLRIVLFSQPRYWDADRRTAKELGLDFELATVKDPAGRDMADINLSKHADGFLLPEHTFIDGGGHGIVAMHAIRDWDSSGWDATIRGWAAAAR